MSIPFLPVWVKFLTITPFNGQRQKIFKLFFEFFFLAEAERRFLARDA